MQLRDVFDDREAQTRSAQLAAAPFVSAIETLEDAGQITLANSNTSVGNTDAHPIAGKRCPQGNHPARLRIFHRVVEKVVNDLLKPVLVRLQKWQIVRNIKVWLELFGFESFLPVSHD